jgi:phosphotransferase system enzyme I (PtsI)
MSGEGATTSGSVVNTPTVLEGIPGSAGYAIGSALIVDTRRTGVVRRHIMKEDVDVELGRFAGAVATAASELRETSERLQSKSTRTEASILEAYMLMVEDETLQEEVLRRVRDELLCAEWALDVSIADMSARLRQSGDVYLAERSHDFEFVGERILRAMTGGGHRLALPETGPCVLVAHDLSPAETAGLTKERVQAIVTEVGTRTSHTAILARALEIPAVVGVGRLLTKVGNRDRLAVDGVRGRIVLHPDDVTISEIQDRTVRFGETARLRREARDRPVMTRCGVLVELRANIELPAEAEIALQQGARGIGLYRTEFLYVDRSEPPTEDEQYETYRRVVETLAPLPVTLRTFDIGGDKFVSVFQVPSEMNPALGLRAVRLGLARPEIFLTQLRAMVRASCHGKLRVMVPMVASLRELREVRKLMDQAVREVDAAGLPRASEIPLGIMVEVPSAAIMAHEFAAMAEFMSIGTNDLVQYALAVDRSSPELAYLASFFDPAILRLIRGVITAGKHHNRPVFLCGAMASDPMAALLLVGMGLRELSMEASAIAEVREVLAYVSVAEAEEAANLALEQLTAEEVEKVLVERFGSILSRPAD